MVQDLEGEVWLVIKNHPNYLISNKGRVKSIARWYDNKASGWRFIKERLLACGVNASGYCRVSFSLGSRKDIAAYRVHRLVADAFIPNTENKPFVNHINAIKTDNRVENLEWCTGQENTIHAIDMGLRSGVGEDNVKAKCTAEQIMQIRLLFENGKSRKEIRSFYPFLSKSSVERIVARRSWKHL